MVRSTVAAQIAFLRKQQEALVKKETALKARTHDKALSKIFQLAKDAGLTAKDTAQAFGVIKTKK